MPRYLSGTLIVSLLAVTTVTLRADNDSIEAPWGTVHADLSGTAATTGMDYTLGEGPMEEKWSLDIVAAGHDRPAGRSSITFDKDGNLYWITWTTGGTGGVVRLVSVAPDGTIRWFGNDGAGGVHGIGSIFSGASPVVGQARVYVLGDIAPTLAMAAYDKATGENLWTADLSPSTVAQATVLTPALYQGKLYAVGLSDGKSRDVHKIDAETGEVDWTVTIPEVGIAAVGQMAFVPDGFGPGLHGLYFNGDSGSGSDGVGEVYGIQIAEDEATLGWQSEGGLVWRSHVIYSEFTNHLYTLAFSDYGPEFHVFDPQMGFVMNHSNSLVYGHGCYDVGALDFDGDSIIGGAFMGTIFRYSDDGANITDQLVYKGGTSFNIPFWGENRVLGQLLQDASGNSILITGTNNVPCCNAQVVAVDINNGKLLWSYDTGIQNPHQFIFAGGPLAGPDGKVYYFRRPADGTTALVAIGPAAAEPPPTAGFLLARDVGGGVWEWVDPAVCVKAGELLRADGGCSTGKGLTYIYTADPPDGVEIVQEDSSSPAAEITFTKSGDFAVFLTVENGAGSAESSSAVCVTNVAPTCAISVTDTTGGPLDNADDADDIPCLPAGGAAIADGGASTGGDIEYTFTVNPSEGVTIDQGGDTTNPVASITFADEGVYQVRLLVRNDAGQSQCARTICVKAEAPPGGNQKPFDVNQDLAYDLSDAIALLQHLFLGTVERLPCGDGTVDDPANKALIDANGDGGIDLSDAIWSLGFLFLGQPKPPSCVNDDCPCIRIVNCPDTACE